MIDNLAVKVGKLEERMSHVEEGVSNFRDFQTETREFISEWRGSEKERTANEDRTNKAQNLRVALIGALAIVGEILAHHLWK